MRVIHSRSEPMIGWLLFALLTAALGFVLFLWWRGK